MRLAALLAVTLALAVPAFADDATESPSLLEQIRPGGRVEQWRGRLAERGVEPYLVYTGSMWSNVSGGIRTGTEFDGYLDTGFDIDLEKLGAWRGLGLQASLHWFQGRKPTELLVGASLAQAVNPWEASNAIRVFNLYLSQRFGDGGVVRVGQLAVDSDFMLSRYAATMLNAAFGDLPSQNVNLDVPVYPVAGPGIYAASGLGEALTGRLGVYTADTAPDTAGNHGFEWRLGNNAGYALLLELTASGAPGGLPGAYTAGGCFASVRQPTWDGNGLVHAQWAGWLIVDQALRLDARGNPAVGVFARFSWSPDDGRSAITIYGDAGLNVFGPIRGRPEDVLGFAGSVGRYADAFRRGEQPPSGGAAALELTYQIAATPWLVVQPDLQYLIDPIAAGATDAIVIGLEMVLTF
ncbi:MAG: carbohydrate porin [Deltaproteobacteria bacterium]|nr:carbohydrate porin [Deltaproteobacteria bacterium]